MLPWLTTFVYNQVETIVFGNKSKRIVFYDKYKECLASQCPVDDAANAKGVLRLEIKPADYEMKKYAASRKASVFLTFGFYEYVMNRCIQRITGSLS